MFNADRSPKALEFDGAQSVIQPSFGAGPSTARGGKYRPKPLLPTAQAIECRPTSKRSDKFINITLLGLSLGLRLRQFIITDSRQHRREQRWNHHRHRRYAAPDSVRLETGLLVRSPVFRLKGFDNRAPSA